MLIVCPVCRKNITNEIWEGVDHICLHTDIIKHVEEVEKQKREAESELREIRNSIQHIARKFHQDILENKEIIPVDLESMKELYYSAKIYARPSTETKFDVEDDLTGWMATWQILIHASDLFTSKSPRNVIRKSDGKYVQPNPLEKLKNLFKSVYEAYKLFGYLKEEKLDISPEQLIQDLKENDYTVQD